METPQIELELRKLGLKEKEVRVYLEGLKLGPTSIKIIADAAKITRPTVYEIIKELEKKQLFVEAKQKGKRYFIAQSPESILGMLKVKKRELEEKEREFIRIIAVLESKYFLKEKGIITVYKGEKGLQALEENLSFTPTPEIFVISSKTDSKEIKKREALYQQIKKRLGKIEVKEIYPKTIKSTSPYIQRKSLSFLNLKGTLILSDKAVFFPLEKPEGFLIENELIADLFKSLFLSLWS